MAIDTPRSQIAEPLVRFYAVTKQLSNADDYPFYRSSDDSVADLAEIFADAASALSEINRHMRDIQSGDSPSQEIPSTFNRGCIIDLHVVQPDQGETKTRKKTTQLLEIKDRCLCLREHPKPSLSSSRTADKYHVDLDTLVVTHAHQRYNKPSGLVETIEYIAPSGHREGYYRQLIEHKPTEVTTFHRDVFKWISIPEKFEKI